MSMQINQNMIKELIDSKILREIQNTPPNLEEVYLQISAEIVELFRRALLCKEAGELNLCHDKLTEMLLLLEVQKSELYEELLTDQSDMYLLEMLRYSPYPHLDNEVIKISREVEIKYIKDKKTNEILHQFILHIENMKKECLEYIDDIKEKNRNKDEDKDKSKDNDKDKGKSKDKDHKETQDVDNNQQLDKTDIGVLVRENSSQLLMKTEQQFLNPRTLSLLKKIFQKEEIIQEAIKERTFILSNPNLREYYFTFKMQFNSILLACSVMSTGMIEKAGTPLDEMKATFKQMLTSIPLVGGVIYCVFEICKIVDYLKQKKAINNAGSFLHGAATIERVSEVLARQLIISQIDMLTTSKLFSPPFQQRQNLTTMKDRILVNDIDTPIKKLADKHFKNLLKAIFEDTIEKMPALNIKGNENPALGNIEPLLKVILGDDYLNLETRKQKFDSYKTLFESNNELNLGTPMLFSSDSKKISITWHNEDDSSEVLEFTEEAGSEEFSLDEEMRAEELSSTKNSTCCSIQ